MSYLKGRNEAEVIECTVVDGETTKKVYLGLSSSTGSSLARDMLDMTITSMMKLSNNFLVTNQ
jgi:hypothetical protein